MNALIVYVIVSTATLKVNISLLQGMTVCDKFPLTCPNQCDGIVCRGDMDDHRKTCPLETIDCEYCMVGCKAEMLRKDLEKHSEDNMKQHLF